MKIKRFLSGFFAAVMSIVLIAAPLSTAIAAEDDTDSSNEECIIKINYPASTGTYTAYPIFEGNVEMETNDEQEETGRLLIDAPKFHKNLETMINSNAVASKSTNSNYGLWEYLKINGTKINEVSFYDMIKAYDPNSNGSFNFNNNFTSLDASKQAEALANILNLTSNDTTAIDYITGNGKYSAFYSAFAEAARMFMVDNAEDKNAADLEDVVSVSASNAKQTTVNGKEVKQLEIIVKKPGYYLVEYTPDNYEPTDYDSPPKKVRRSLVLVGKGTKLSATINSKDTQNIASVDVTFNENILDKLTCEGETPKYNYPGNETSQTAAAAEGHWKKNVSAGNGDYVNCRVVVTLPGNLAAYDQYYLAVPIMYGYNVASNLTNEFDHDKSIIRQTDETTKTENVKVYFLDGENKININNDSFTISENYTYANNTTTNKDGLAVSQDWFVANETFVFKDIANIDVRADGATDTVLAKNSNYNKLVIEFPVKFDRFNDDTLPVGVTNNLGFDGTGTNSTNYTGDDALLKNYITAKAVYSNNPNLKALKKDVSEDDLPNSEKLYLNTSKEPGMLQNPVGITKESSSANIVTYRLRVHATTEDLKNLSQVGGVEGVKFVLYDNANGKYALVTALKNKTTGDITTYDTVSGETLRENGSFTTYQGKVGVYKITGWTKSYNNSSGENEEETLNDACVLTTFNNRGNYTAWANNNSGRFEIVGLAPGDYTIITLDETIKTFVEYKTTSTDNDWKEYLLPKENGKRKTEYRFSFAPELSNTCTKLSYYTHYAPINTDDKWDNAGSYAAAQSLHSSYFNTESINNNSIITKTDKLITNFKMKWYDMEGTEITKEKADWWLGQRDDVNLMSMRITYIKKGLSLPVTGGIGTFIFYAVGGVLVIISIVAIITKIRIKREQL